MSPEARAKMRASWTPERRAAQAERARKLHRRRVATPQQVERARYTRALIRRIRRPKTYNKVRHKQTEVPVLLEGIVVQVVLRFSGQGLIQATTRWRKVKMQNGVRVGRWTPEARRAQAERLKLYRNLKGPSPEVRARAVAESVRRRRLRAAWNEERREAQREKARARFGLGVVKVHPAVAAAVG